MISVKDKGRQYARVIGAGPRLERGARVFRPIRVRDAVVALTVANRRGGARGIK
jgi:hypothetical protein